MRMLATTILILLFFWVAFSTWEKRFPRGSIDYVLNTEPIYCNQPVDTTPYFFLIPWDFQWILLPSYCCNWYPICGGCVVYDNQFPFHNFDNHYFPVTSNQMMADTTLCLDTIKKSPEVEDFLKFQDSIVTPRKSWRHKVRLWFQNLRSAGRKYQDTTTNAKVSMHPNISPNPSPMAT